MKLSLLICDQVQREEKLITNEKKNAKQYNLRSQVYISYSGNVIFFLHM